jgi:hypothetical protein
MNVIQEYALLVVAATPVLIIVGLQIFLFLYGERGTLLLPDLHSFPRMDEVAPVQETLDREYAPVAVQAEAIAEEEPLAQAA